LLVLISY